MAHFLQRLPVELRPKRSLLGYYAVVALATGPGFPFVFLYFLGRYRTLRYQVEEEGITARWGVLFRREVSLNYARIQDIHLSSNLLERWLGLGRIQIQTASAQAGAELTLEGLEELEGMRDFLYSRMRGGRDQALPSHEPDAIAPGRDDELTATLRAVVEELRALRAELRDRHEGP